MFGGNLKVLAVDSPKAQPIINGLSPSLGTLEKFCSIVNNRSDLSVGGSEERGRAR